MFDKQYYEIKKQNLEQRLIQKKNKIIGLVGQALNQYYGEEAEIMTEIQEISTILEGFKEKEKKED